MEFELSKGRIGGAKKIVIYGPEGIGKSTFASSFPGAAFIDTEGSTKEMDVMRYPTPTSWQMLLQEVQATVDYAKKGKKLCETLVLDTADWAEQLEIKDICAKNHWESIESPGYGKGYTYCAEEFGKLLNMLSSVVDAGINVVVTAHAQLRKVELPEEMGAYDHWEMKTTKKVAPMIREWADAVFFANYKTMVVEVDKKKKAQGGRRVMYTNHTPFWDAKNRYGLPDSVPFSFDSIARIFEDPIASLKKENPDATIWQDPETGRVHVLRPIIPDLPDPDIETKAPADTEAQTKSKEKPAEKTEAKKPSDEEIRNIDRPVTEDVKKSWDGLPKALQDLMAANNVDVWDIENVVSAKGYFPPDMHARDYPLDFVDGVLIGAWDQVYDCIVKMKQDQEIPFN